MKKQLIYFCFAIIFLFHSDFTSGQSCQSVSTCSGTNPYPCTSCGNCTWWAWNQANCKFGVSLPGWGNARNWAQSASAAGYTVSMTPAVNTIACLSNNSYGHVAWVEEILPNNKIRVSEMNYDTDGNGDCIPYGSGVNSKIWSISSFNQGFIYLHKPINNNLDIYAGPKDSPHENVLIYCFPPSANSTFNIGNFKINESDKVLSITNQSFLNGRVSFRANFKNVIQNPATGPFKFEFDVTSNGKTTHFFSDKLYFLNIGDYMDANIQALDNWSLKYIGQGTRNGLFKGSKISGSWIFNPSGYLTKGQACKIIVSAMLRLGMITGVNANQPGVLPNDPITNSTSEFKPFYYTLINWATGGGLSIIPTDNNNSFDLSQNINIEDFGWMINKVFSLPSVPNVKSKVSDIKFSGSLNSERMEALKKIANIFIPVKDVNGNTLSAESIATMFKYKSNGLPIVSCSAFIVRSAMAKVLTNVYIWKADQLGITDLVNARVTANSDLSNFYILGDKFEGDDNVSGNTPALSQQIKTNYTINDNESLTLSHSSDYDEANNGVPLYFYWTADGGDTLKKITDNFRSVVFTPGKIIGPTTFHLYSQAGNTLGKVREYNIEVLVKPTNLALTTNTPTQQAANLQIVSNGENNLNLSWTRGNGSYCIVTCTPLSSNIVPPSLNRY